MLNQIEKQEIFRVLATQIPRLQISEFEAAYRNNLDKTDDTTVLTRLLARLLHHEVVVDKVGSDFEAGEKRSRKAG